MHDPFWPLRREQQADMRPSKILYTRQLPTFVPAAGTWIVAGATHCWIS